MPIDYEVLLPKIDRILDRIARKAQQTQALILTESDLKCLLYAHLRRLPELALPIATRDNHVLGTAVHTEVSWYGEPRADGGRRLCITPDITILEPEHLSILHGTTLDFLPPKYLYNSSYRYRYQPLPSKGVSFEGKAVTFELKFTRDGIRNRQLQTTREHGIHQDLAQIRRLINILDNRGDGDKIFSYLVIFDRFNSWRTNSDLVEFLEHHRIGHRYKVFYASLDVA